MIRKKGVTLVELMITTVVLVVAIVAMVHVFMFGLRMIAIAREINIATDDAKDVLEIIKATAFTDITTAFPDEQMVDADIIGGFSLRDESIVVRYLQGAGDDPLEIEVVVTWTREDKRTAFQSFRTIRTSTL